MQIDITKDEITEASKAVYDVSKAYATAMDTARPEVADEFRRKITLLHSVYMKMNPEAADE